MGQHFSQTNDVEARRVEIDNILDQVPIAYWQALGVKPSVALPSHSPFVQTVNGVFGIRVDLVHATVLPGTEDL